MPEYQPSHPLHKRKPEPSPCTIHRQAISSKAINGRPYILSLPGCTKILKVTNKESEDIQLWYLSSPELPEANLEFWIFPTGHEVPNHLSYVDTVIWRLHGLVWHVFVNPQSFPKDRPYIAH